MPSKVLAVIALTAAVLAMSMLPAVGSAAPTATTEAATGLENPVVTLNGTVNPGGEDTAYHFEYTDEADFEENGYANAVGTPSEPKGIGSGTGDIKVSQPIGSLEPGTTYHFRLVAENNQGTAVGDDETFATPEWAIADTEDPEGASNSTLLGSSCATAVNCVAVGHYTDASEAVLTLAQHREGGEWQIHETPNPEGANQSKLSAVSCSSATDCVAVGHYYDASWAMRPLAEHWDGREWQLLSPPMPAESEGARLESVSCSSTSNCIAVGHYAGEFALAPLVMSYDGEGWSIQQTAQLPPLKLGGLTFEVGEFLGVSCSANGCTAVGTYESGSFFSPEEKALIQQYDGEEWTLEPLPGEGAPIVLTDVSCPSLGFCVAVDGEGLELAGFDEDSWTLESAPEASEGSGGTLKSISCTSSTACAAAGHYDGPSTMSSPLIERWDGAEWLPQQATEPFEAFEETFPYSTLHSISCATASACVATGQYVVGNNPFTIKEALVVEAHPPGDAPTATTGAATGLGNPEITLHGTVNPGGEDTAYRFEYTDEADFEENGYGYAISVPTEPKSIGSGVKDIEVSQQVGGLVPETGYRFRVTAENLSGASHGESESFVTPGPPDCHELIAPAPTAEPRDLSIECDGDGDLTYEISSEPEHGSISGFDAGTGALVYTSEEEFIGTDSFTFRASNAAGDSNLATATIDVCPWPGIGASGAAIDPRIPGVELEVQTALGESPCEPEMETHEGEPGQNTSLRVYVDEELVASEERNCDAEAEVFCDSAQLYRVFQLPYEKVIGWHVYRIEAEDDLGNEAKPLEWTEDTPADGTISAIPPRATDAKGSKGCETPKNRYKHYVFRGKVVYGTDCADILGRYLQENTKIYRAGPGDDVIRAGGEINTINGGAGDDRIYAGRGNDKVFGEGGSDQVLAGSGDDKIFGNEGSDILAGASGADEIEGGSGDDLIRGGTTADKLNGGPGTNTLSFTDAVTPGFEYDAEFLTGFPAPGPGRGVFLNLGEAPIEDGDETYIRAFNGNTARFGGGADRLYVDNGSFQNVIGSPFADVIIGSGEANVIDSSGGPDIVEGGGGSDQLYGGADSDLLDGDEGQEAGGLHGGDGDDVCLNGVEGAQSCERETTAEGLKPTSPGAIVVGRVSPGNPSHDTGIYLRGSNVADNVTATWDGGHEKEVNDVVHFVAKGKSGSGRFDTATNGVSGCAVTESQATCPLSAVHTLIVDGGSGGDVLKAHGFPASIAVTLLGGADKDVLHGGGVSEDVLVDGPGEGKDDLFGFGGDDTFFANAGRDRLYGGGGSDLFVSSETCEDRILGGGDRDNASWAQLRGAPKGTSGEFHPPANGVEASLPQDEEVWGDFASFGEGCENDGQLKEVEFLEGSGGKDKLEGDDAHNIILGRSGKDRLIGLGGDDNLLANNRDPAGETEEREHDPDESLNCGGGHDVLLYDKPYDEGAIDESCERSRPGPATQSSVISGIGSEATAEASTTAIDEDVIGGAGDPEATPPTAFFRFDETEGEVAANWIDAEVSGAYEEGVALDEPGAMEESQGIHLDGEDDRVELTTEWDPVDFAIFESCGPQVASGYSVEIWVKFDAAASGREELFSRSEEASGVFLYRSGDGRLNFSVGRPSESPTVRSDEPVSYGEWHHVVAVLEIESRGCPTFAGDSSSIDPPRITLYVDGFAYPLGIDEPFPPSIPSATNLVGAREGKGGTANFLSASVDDVAIYGHPLEEADVQAHMEIGDALGASVILVPPVDPGDGDADEDGVRDSVDNCLEAANADQEDSDGDGIGDACQVDPDSDEDEVPDETDNCPEDANKEQVDTDENGVGDACEPE